MQQTSVSVIIPAFNEQRSIGDILLETTSIMESLGMPYEIIVVDDGSTDSTTQIALRYKATVLTNEKNYGKGYALRKGFQCAGGGLIVTIDADGSHKPKEIPDLIDPLLNGVDIVNGSRLAGRGKDSISRLNLLGNYMLNFIIMLLTRKHISDSQTGFRAFKKDVLKKINLESSGYEIDTEITVKGLNHIFTFRELPVSCEKRKFDTSKLKIISDGVRIFRAILKANFINTCDNPEN